MVDIMDVYKLLNISTETVMCRNVVKKLPYLLRYVPDQYNTQQCAINQF